VGQPARAPAAEDEADLGAADGRAAVGPTTVRGGRRREQEQRREEFPGGRPHGARHAVPLQHTSGLAVPGRLTSYVVRSQGKGMIRAKP